MKIWFALAFVICVPIKANADSFYVDFLDINQDQEIDITKFEMNGYMTPGVYELNIVLNGKNLRKESVKIVDSEDRDAPNYVCFSDDQIDLLGLAHGARDKLFSKQDSCNYLKINETSTIDLSSSNRNIRINIPSEFIEYTEPNWSSTRYWDSGIPGAIFDYNLNFNATDYIDNPDRYSASGNGIIGLNYELWRLRSYWQGRTGNLDTKSKIEINRTYLYRPIVSQSALFLAGENYVDSSVFDSWKFLGLTIKSDNSQIAPNLRSYSPSISGIAKTNAKITISQKDRIIYETTVPPGYFSIDNLTGLGSGFVDVVVEEQDGERTYFQVDSYSSPYLVRPKKLDYSISLGKPIHDSHKVENELFYVGEATYGVSNQVTVLGGNVYAENYQAYSLGVANTVLDFASMSDVFLLSKSSKSSHEYGYKYQFAISTDLDSSWPTMSMKYSFQDQYFQNMNDGSNNSAFDDYYERRSLKTVSSISLGKKLPMLNMSLHLNYSYQDYWKVDDNQQRYDLTINKNFNFDSMKNVSSNLMFSHASYLYSDSYDDSIWLNIHIPLSNGNLSYNGNWNNGRYIQNTTYTEKLDTSSNYRVSYGTQSGDGDWLRQKFSGFYERKGSNIDLSTGMSWNEGRYTSLNMSLSGGITFSEFGVVTNPFSNSNLSRVIIDTHESGVPINDRYVTNADGLAVVPNINNYYTSSVSLNISNFPDDMEPYGSPVTEFSLIAGSIGYKKFDIIKGSKKLFKIHWLNNINDSKYPPLGASITNIRNQEVGIVGDEGISYVVGLKGDEILNVNWATGSCSIHLFGDEDENIDCL